MLIYSFAVGLYIVKEIPLFSTHKMLVCTFRQLYGGTTTGLRGVPAAQSLSAARTERQII